MKHFHVKILLIWLAIIIGTPDEAKTYLENKT